MKKLILGSKLLRWMSSSMSQFASKSSSSGEASPAWNTACSMCFESEASDSKRVNFSAPDEFSISVRILLFSFIKYLKTDSSRDILECWQKFLKLDRFSLKATVLLFLTQMSIKLT